MLAIPNSGSIAKLNMYFGKSSFEKMVEIRMCIIFLQLLYEN